MRMSSSRTLSLESQLLLKETFSHIDSKGIKKHIHVILYGILVGSRSHSSKLFCSVSCPSWRDDPQPKRTFRRLSDKPTSVVVEGIFSIESFRQFHCSLGLFDADLKTSLFLGKLTLRFVILQDSDSSVSRFTLQFLESREAEELV
jgi:hypothetical protein